MNGAQRSLWALTAITVLAAGATTQILATPASLTTHLLLVASLTVLATSATLLIRVLRHLTHPRRSPHRDQVPLRTRNR